MWTYPKMTQLIKLLKLDIENSNMWLKDKRRYKIRRYLYERYNRNIIKEIE